MKATEEAIQLMETIICRRGETMAIPIKEQMDVLAVIAMEDPLKKLENTWAFPWQ